MYYLNEWKGLFRHWREDLLAGITVGVVALPLALGFAITTGAPASTGLTTAVIAGFIAALFGGSNYQVSGPTGAMTVVLVPIVSQYGVASLTIIGAIAGTLILLMAILRLGRFIDRIPFAVMEGFTLGIALIIALQQVPLILEIPKSEGTHTLEIALKTFASALDSEFHWTAIFLALSTLVIKRKWIKFQNLLKIPFRIPGSIVAVFVMTLFSIIAQLDIQRIEGLPRSISLSTNFSRLDIPFIELFYAAFVVALLGAIESLLSARVADGMAHKVIGPEIEKHNPNRELLGQGLGTIASACVGGLPATGAIARTGVNVNSGAQSRLAAIFHSIFLLLVVLFFAPIVSYIPTSVLAGVLLGTSLRIASPQSIREALTTTFAGKLTYISTAISVLLIDLIWGILIGLLVYLMAKKFESQKTEF
jgi:SulP family sulfate permease